MKGGCRGSEWMEENGDVEEETRSYKWTIDEYKGKEAGMIVQGEIKLTVDT